jgi:pyridoxamine 5'-phosphate oxidase
MSTAADKPNDPIQRLRALFEEARQRDLEGATSASLASASATTQPSVRMVTILGIDEHGPIFFTDRRSGKGRQLVENPQAAMCFYWPALNQQVALEGVGAWLAEHQAEHYWARQPHANRLAAWVGDTPPPADEPDSVDARLRAIRRRFGEETVTRPPDWQAVRLEADLCQFWKTGWRRLHLRERYYRGADGAWQKEVAGPL